jgi:MarR family transcriptional regulator, lower aerobic nicotinate degradation pathway regulator
MSRRARERQRVAGKQPGPAGPAAAAAAVDPAQTLHRLLKLSNRLLQPFSVYLEHQHRISVNEFRVLMLIGRLGTTASHELADLTGVNTMSVSRAVSALRRHGRVRVSTDPRNRRRKTLTLTAEGSRLYRTMLPSTDKVAGYLFEALQREEMLAFDRHLKILIAALEARDEEGRSLFLERTRPDEVRPGRGRRLDGAADRNE